MRLPRGARKGILSTATLVFAALIAFLIWGMPGALAAAGGLILVWSTRPGPGPDDPER